MLICVSVRSDSDAFMVAAIEEENAAVAEGENENIIACSAQHFETALTDAFNRTDEEFGKADNAALVGTTAVVALVGSRQLYVANCGGSPVCTLSYSLCYSCLCRSWDEA